MMVFHLQDQGWIFAAFNAGLLCMLLTGFMADKFNAKCLSIVNRQSIMSIHFRHDHPERFASFTGQHWHSLNGQLEVCQMAGPNISFLS